MKLERKIRAAQAEADEAETCYNELFSRIVALAAVNYQTAVMNAFVNIDHAAADARSYRAADRVTGENYLKEAEDFIAATSTAPEFSRGLLKEYLRQTGRQQRALERLAQLEQRNTRF